MIKSTKEIEEKESRIAFWEKHLKGTFPGERKLGDNFSWSKDQDGHFLIFANGASQMKI